MKLPNRFFKGNKEYIKKNGSLTDPQEGLFLIVEGGKILVSRAIREDSNQTKLIWAKKEQIKYLKLVLKLDFFLWYANKVSGPRGPRTWGLIVWNWPNISNHLVPIKLFLLKKFRSNI